MDGQPISADAETELEAVTEFDGERLFGVSSEYLSFERRTSNTSNHLST